MKIKLQDLERKILSLKELDLSRQEVIKRTRSYVDLCVDISTFQELKEIVFKHIPKKIFATAPRKLYEWVETRNDGVEHIHADYWKNLPKQLRFQILKRKRYKKTRLHDNDRPTHRNKGYSSVIKQNILKGKILYYEDSVSKKVSIIRVPKEADPFNYARITLKSTGGGFVFKKAYKEQFIPKSLVKKKTIKVKAANAITPEKEFIKGKGMVLTEKGKQQKKDLYYRNKIGKKLPVILSVTTESVIDFKIDKNRVHTKQAASIPNNNKQLIKAQDKVKKEMYKFHRLEISRNISRKNRAPKKPIKINKLRQSLLNISKLLQKLGILPKETIDLKTLRKEKTLKNRELRKQRRSFNTAKKLKENLEKNPNFIPLIDLGIKYLKPKIKKEKIKKEIKISEYASKRTAKIKLAFQKRTDVLKKHISIYHTKTKNNDEEN